MGEMDKSTPRLRDLRLKDRPQGVGRKERSTFKSDCTFSGAPDYSLQTAQQSGIHALCLVTYDVDPEAPLPFQNVYYSYYSDLIEY
jgi:hypothetical protein